MINPSIWTNRKFIRCSDKEKLLYIGLFSTADDYGKLWYDPLSIKASIFPCDNFTEDEIRSSILKLAELNLICTDEKVIKIHGWSNHQSVPKPQKSNIPEPLQNHYSNVTELVPKCYCNDSVAAIHGEITGSAKERKKKRKKERDPTIDLLSNESEISTKDVKQILNEHMEKFSDLEYEIINSLIEEGKHLSARIKIDQKINTNPSSIN